MTLLKQTLALFLTFAAVASLASEPQRIMQASPALSSVEDVAMAAHRNAKKAKSIKKSKNRSVPKTPTPTSIKSAKQVSSASIKSAKKSSQVGIKSSKKTSLPTANPSATPSTFPTEIPSDVPSETPSLAASSPPSDEPSEAPSAVPSVAPTSSPTSAPTHTPSAAPSTTTTSTSLNSVAPGDNPTVPSPSKLSTGALIGGLAGLVALLGGGYVAYEYSKHDDVPASSAEQESEWDEVPLDT